MLVAVLVVIFLIWALFFNDNGVLQNGYSALAGVINDTWGTVTGDSSAKIIPETFGGADVETEGSWKNSSTQGF